MRVTMRQVAAHAGVSLKTVSRVFNDDERVSPQTRERVLASMRALDYRPNGLAKSFRTGRTGTLGVVLPDVTDPFFATLLAGIDDRARDRGVVAVATSVGNSAELERDVVRTLAERHIDGLILAPSSTDLSWLAEHIDPSALMLVDRRPRGVQAPAIVNDDAAAVVLALDALRSRGCSRVALAGGVPGQPTTLARQQAFRDSAAAQGFAVEERLICDSAAAAELVRQEAVDGVLACSPHAAVSILRSLRTIRVPLACIGDFPLSDLLSPKPIVVDQDPYLIGQAAVDDLLDGVSLDHVRVVPVHIRSETEVSHVAFAE